MFDTRTDPEQLLEVPSDLATHLQQVEALRTTLHHTATHQHDGVKELADHGRALNKLSAALALVDECAEAISLRQQAIAIWRALDRRSAAHIATIELAALHDRHDDASTAAALLDTLTHDQLAEPLALGKPYRLTLRAAQARHLARRGEHREALDMLRPCIRELAHKHETPLYARLVRLEALIVKMSVGICTNEQK